MTVFCKSLHYSALLLWLPVFCCTFAKAQATNVRYDGVSQSTVTEGGLDSKSMLTMMLVFVMVFAGLTWYAEAMFEF